MDNTAIRGQYVLPSYFINSKVPYCSSSSSSTSVIFICPSLSFIFLFSKDTRVRSADLLSFSQSFANLLRCEYMLDGCYRNAPTARVSKLGRHAHTPLDTSVYDSGYMAVSNVNVSIFILMYNRRTGEKSLFCLIVSHDCSLYIPSMI